MYAIFGIWEMKMEIEKEVHEMNTEGAHRRGRIVFAVLAVLTVVEFVVSVWLSGPLPVLGLIALAKAALIIVYFMHAGDLGVVWRKEVSQ